MAKVIQIFKADDESDPNNYRLIFLLSSVNRIFEKLMYRVKCFLEIDENSTGKMTFVHIRLYFINNV